MQKKGKVEKLKIRKCLISVSLLSLMKIPFLLLLKTLLLCSLRVAVLFSKVVNVLLHRDSLHIDQLSVASTLLQLSLISAVLHFKKC